MKTKTKQELLQDRAAAIARQRELLDKAKAESRTLTPEEAAEFDRLDQEIEAIDKQIREIDAMAERESRVAARERDLDQPANRTWRPNDFVPGAPSMNNRKLDDGGFANLGEFLDAVRFGDPKGRLDHLRKNPSGNPGFEVPEAFRAALFPWFRNEWSTTTAAPAIPDQFRPDVLMLQPESAIVRPRANVIPPGDPPDARITIPAFQQGAQGVFGGVDVQWIGEGQDKPETSGALTEIALQPYEVAATTVVTDKLLRNWQAANTFITNLLRSAMAAAEDLAFLKGDGNGKPTGILNAAGALKVNRATANKVTYADVVNMVAKLLPESVGRALWIANQSLLPQLATLKDENGNYIFIQGDATRGIPTTLAGIPIRFTGKVPALGSMGDLILVDLQYYLIKDGSGPFVAASEHVLFRQNKTVIKCFWNVDGKPWVPAPLTLEDGTTKVSPYVILDVPAA